MRNLLEEFSLKRGKHYPSILGVREHVFTGRYYLLTFSKYVVWIISAVKFSSNNIMLFIVSLPWPRLCPIRKLVS